MTVGELLEILQDMPEEAEVRIAYQPSYPLEVGIGEVVEVPSKRCEPCDGEGKVECPKCDGEGCPGSGCNGLVLCEPCLGEGMVGAPVVYVGEGSGRNGYLNRAAAAELGWR